jgi:imidazoleglycerol-phosphate dehydratase
MAEQKVTSRKSEITRATRETDISLTLDPDDAVPGGIATGLPFFDHLLSSMSFHGRLGLKIAARGDVDVDPHHLVEDVGLVLGQAFAAVMEKTGAVARFAHAVIPMDEALAEVTIDVCGRPTLSLCADFPQPIVGTFDISLLREFLGGLAGQARVSLHVDIRRGENSHHMAEAAFKALGKALHDAYAPSGQEMSSKGRIG